MRDDDPEDTLADALRRSGVRRTPGGGPGDRHDRDHRGHVAAPRSPATTAAGTRRTGWSSSVAGGIDHAEVRPLGAAGLRRPARDPTQRPRCPAQRPRPVPDARRTWWWSTGTSNRRTCASGCPRLARGDPRRHALAVLSTALGGGMSSRLFRLHPRGARTGLLLLLGDLRLRRDRLVLGLRGLPPGEPRQGRRADRRRAGIRGRDRPRRARTRPGEGPAHRFAGAGPGGHRVHG